MNKRRVTCHSIGVTSQDIVRPSVWFFEVRHLAEVLLDYMTFVALVFATRLSFALGCIEMERKS